MPAALTAQIRTVYVIPSSHWDRGFVTNPEKLLPRVKPHIDQVIDAAAADPEFRWTIESIWQLNEWLIRTQDPKRLALLRDLVKKGQIEISASYGSMHTEFMDPEELNLWTQDSFRMARALGVDHSDLAMMDDVPGFVRWLPQVLAASGVHYFLNGSNLFIGGGTSLAPGNVPFYWESPDGSRVLTWVSQGANGGYVEGMTDYYLAPTTPDPYAPGQLLIPKELQGKPPLQVMELGMKKLLETYQKAGYKYDAVLVMYVHDFVPPSDEVDHLLPMVRAWNASGRKPEIRVATPKEFFTHIVSTYDHQIPTYQGDWSGLWTGVKTNSPGISALARRDQMSLRANGLLWAALQLRDGITFPSGNMLEDYRRLWNYDEHSGGGQTGWPDLMTVREVNDQNRDYVDYVSDANQNQLRLFEEAVGLNVGKLEKLFPASHPSTPGPLLVVYRPQNWAATSLVNITALPNDHRPAAFKDVSSGKTFSVQWDLKCPTAAGDRQAQSCGVMAAPLPATGVAVFEPMAQSPAVETTGNPKLPATASGPRLQNRYYDLELRSSDGAITRLTDRESGKQIVNTAAREGFNELVLAAGLERVSQMAAPVRFVASHGRVFDSLDVQRPGGFAPVTEYRLYHAVKRLEIRNLLLRSRLPVVTESSKANVYQFAFPVLPGTSISSFRYLNGIGVTTFPQDYLPGARMDAVVSHALVFSDGDFHVALASPQAFYWDVPSMNKQHWGLWQNEILSSALRKNESGSTRDYGHYIFPTLEPGLPDQLWLVYELDSWTGPWSDGGAYRRIWDAVMEPMCAIEPWASMGSIKDGQESFFTTDQPDIVVIAAAASLSQTGAVILRLQNLSDKHYLTRVNLPAGGLEATEVDLTEAPVGVGPLSVEGRQLQVEVGAHATVSILVSRPGKR
jgi:hypothetical protein